MNNYHFETQSIERLIPSQKASYLNFQIKRDNVMINNHRLNLLNQLNPKENDFSFNNQLKVLSFSKTNKKKVRTSKIENPQPSTNKIRKRNSTSHSIEKINDLDAPCLVDNWYYSLMKCNVDNDLIAVALGDKMHLYDYKTSQTWICNSVENVYEEAIKIITTVEWIDENRNQICEGYSDGSIELWDVVKRKKMRKLRSGEGEIYSISSRGPLLSIGGNDKKLVHHDLRMRNSVVSRIDLLSSIYSVDWSKDSMKLAVGLENNMALLFDKRNLSVPTNRLSHKSGVGCAKFSPNNHYLSTMGGSDDKVIRFYDLQKNCFCVNELKENNQICDIIWTNDSKLFYNVREDIKLVSPNSKIPLASYQKDKNGNGTERILSLGISKDNQTLYSIKSNETFLLYRITNLEKNKHNSVLFDSLMMR